MQRIIKIFSLALLTLLGCFTATALAAGAATPGDESLLEMAKPIYDAFVHGQKLYAGMLALVLVIAAMKRYAPGKVGAWLQTDIGGALTTLVMSFAGAMATSLAGGVGVSFAMVKAAAMIAVGAAGGYSLIKKLVVEPFLKPLSKKAPAWAQPIFAVVFWIFDKKSPVAEAEAAGEAAVKADPGKGVEAVAGKPTEVE